MISLINVDYFTLIVFTFLLKYKMLLAFFLYDSDNSEVSQFQIIGLKWF